MDVHNLTALLFDLMVRSDTAGESGIFSDMNHTAMDTLLHNLTTLLIIHPTTSNDSMSLLNLLADMEKEDFWWKMVSNRRLGNIASIVLITAYTLLVTAGTLGNVLVIWAVIRQPAMRTLRNTFIINLAISDLLLCLIATPITLVEIISKYWPLGDSALSCKLAGGLQAVSVFVSTMSISAIALDRYQLIVYPTRDYLRRIGAVAGLLFIWGSSFLLASPIFIFRSLDHHNLMPEFIPHSTLIELHSVDFCYENWPMTHGRALYSAFTILIQYAAPILLVSVVHAKICRRLRLRQSTLATMGKNSRRQASERKRLRRLNSLLITIALVFSLTWLPLNVLNLFLDLHNPFTLPDDQETMLIIYAVCHLLGMTSAVVNPFLYGWFNDNFRNEFKNILGGPIAYFFCARWSTWFVRRLAGLFHTRSSPPIPAEGTEMMEQKRESQDNSGGNENSKKETMKIGLDCKGVNQTVEYTSSCVTTTIQNVQIAPIIQSDFSIAIITETFDMSELN